MASKNQCYNLEVLQSVLEVWFVQKRADTLAYQIFSLLDTLSFMGVFIHSIRRFKCSHTIKHISRDLRSFQSCSHNLNLSLPYQCISNLATEHDDCFHHITVIRLRSRTSEKRVHHSPKSQASKMPCFNISLQDTPNNLLSVQT